LTGRFRGRRVVFLKQLKSGLLLVTGPFKVNGVPLKRVNQAYVVATSTKVDITSCSVKIDTFDDLYFKREKKPSNKGIEEEFFGQEQKQKKEVSEKRVTDQKEIDKQLLASLKKVPHLHEYLRARFSLSKGQFPHSLGF